MDAGRRRLVALAALADLPDGLREPAVLRWVHECSQAQIAAFLDLPVTTVTNRLHTARGRLKRRILAMMKDALSDRSLPEDFPARIGRIVRAEGPLIEARFEPAGPPELFSTLIAADEAGRAVTVQVVQHLPDGRVRAIARDAAAELAPGMQIAERGEPMNTPLGEPVMRSAVARLAPPTRAGRPVLLETGIKVIDLLLPIVRGGAVGLLGGERVGTTVLVEELVRRLATAEFSLFTFVPGVRAEDLRNIRDEGYTLGIGGIQTVFFVADHPERRAPTRWPRARPSSMVCTTMSRRTRSTSWGESTRCWRARGARADRGAWPQANRQPSSVRGRRGRTATGRSTGARIPLSNSRSRAAAGTSARRRHGISVSLIAQR